MKFSEDESTGSRREKPHADHDDSKEQTEMQGSTSVTQLRSLLSPRPTQSYDDCATSFYLATLEEHFFKEAVTQSVCRIFCKNTQHIHEFPLHIAIWSKYLTDVMEAVVYMSKKRLTSELQGKVQLDGRKTEFVLHFCGGA